MMVVGYAASPLVGEWVSTANASSTPTTARAESAMAPAADNGNDNRDPYEDCGTGNPRKDKKCKFNMHVDNDNTDGNSSFNPPPAPVPGNPPGGTIEVSTFDPNRGDTISFMLIASGTELEHIQWWVTDYNNRNSDNDNESSTYLVNGQPYYVACDGHNYCQQRFEIDAGNPGTFTIHAKARDRQGREAYENAVEIRVH